MAALSVMLITPAEARQNVSLLPEDTPEGYLALVLINETAFPGERGYRSEEDTEAGMRAVLWVLHCRIHHVPDGYTQKEIAAVESEDLIDVITAEGPAKQLEGFYRDEYGMFRAAPRVHRRVRYLTKLANHGPPGRISRLLNYAQRLASSYFHAGPGGPDIFKDIRAIESTRVTGRSYSWMADSRSFSPGGRYVRIPNEFGGVLGGNRFYTLQEMSW
jgi:hypothetical protein